MPGASPTSVGPDGQGTSRYEHRAPARPACTAAVCEAESTSLPIAGVDGTLQRRFRKEDLLRKVRAKTGKISGVTTLSGYAVNESNETFAFAILMNDYRCGTETMKRLMDRVCSALVESDVRLTSSTAPATAPARPSVP